MTKTLLCTLFASAFMASTASAAIILGEQDFEGNSLANGLASNAEFLPGTEPGLGFDSGSGLGWSVSFIDSRNLGNGGPLVGTADAGDLIGVSTDFPTVSDGNGNNQIDSSGNTTQYFFVEDADGTIAIAFDQIDATGFENLTLSFDWAANDANYESQDVFDVSINGISVFDVSGDDLESGPFSDTFASVMLDISAFDAGMLDIVFSISNSA
ncbi:MAG: hypothetical protein AAF337_02950, partial [Pseudomonadota bacterium]